MNVLEIHAEGMPRYVGPFPFKFQAEEWASAHIVNGSWSVISPTHPNAIVTDRNVWPGETWEQFQTRSDATP